MKLVLKLLCLLLPVAGVGQTFFDVATLRTGVSPSNGVEGTGDQQSIWEQEILVKTPIERKNGDLIFLSASLHRHTLATSGAEEQTFTDVSLPVGYRRQFNDTWNALFLALPRYATLSRVGNDQADALLPGGLVLVSKRIDAEASWKVGFLAREDLFGPFFLPLFGGWWQASPRLELFGTLPINATARYTIQEPWHVGLHFRAAIGTFGDRESLYLHKTTNEVWFFSEHDLGNHLVLRGQAGVSISRSYRLYDSDDTIDYAVSLFRAGDNRMPLTNELRDGFLGGIHLIYRLDIDPDQ